MSHSIQWLEYGLDRKGIVVQCPKMAEDSLLQTVQTQSTVGQPTTYQNKLCVFSGVKAIRVLGLGIFRSVTPQFRNKLRSDEVCYENMGNFMGSIIGWSKKFASLSRSPLRFWSPLRFPSDSKRALFAQGAGKWVSDLWVKLITNSKLEELVEVYVWSSILLHRLYSDKLVFN